MAAASLELCVVGALSGDHCCRVMASPLWTVQRLKVEIANVHGPPMSAQHLCIGSRSLRNDEVVSAIVEEEATTTLTLLRKLVTPAAPSSDSALVVSSSSETIWVEWTVNCKKLQPNSMSVLSPEFHVDLGDRCQQVPLKILILATEGGSFKKASGRGQIAIKCDDMLPEGNSSLQLSVAVADPVEEQLTRRSFRHDFNRAALCMTPEDANFTDLMLNKSMSHKVFLEVDKTR